MFVVISLATGKTLSVLKADCQDAADMINIREGPEKNNDHR